MVSKRKVLTNKALVTWIALLFIWVSILLSCKNNKSYSGPMQGHTTDSTCILWLSSNENLDFKSHNCTIDTLEILNNNSSKHIIYKLHISKIAHSFKSEIIAYKQNREALFKYPIKKIQKNDTLSILLGSCVYQFSGLKFYLMPGNGFKIFSYMAKENSDMMLWLGDNVYYRKKELDDLDAQWKKNLFVRLKLDRELFLSKGIHYSIWDDHDFGANNSGKENTSKNISKYSFSSFWANPIDSESNENGIYYSFIINDVLFIMLDSRWNRTISNVDNASLFGEEQIDWLKEQLLNDKVKVKFIVSGSQMLNPLEPKETFTKYAKEHNQLLDFIKDEGLKNIFFLSGDRHYSAFISKYYKNTIYNEFSVSPLASFPNDISKKAHGLHNPYLLPGSLYCNQNFGKIDIHSNDIVFTIKNNKGVPVWSKQFILK